MFEYFVHEYVEDKSLVFRNKMIFYCILKTEADIFIELRDFNRAIQAFKALRNYCKHWGMIR